MSANSSIEWTDHTFNPWWGCVKVSPGCEHCYAENLSARYGHLVWGPAKTTTRRLFGDSHWHEPIQWNAAAERERVRKRVFCASMADIFEPHPQLVAARMRLFQLIETTKWLDWLILTKRPENIREMLPETWLGQPRPNVWFGTSVEDRRRALERIPVLTGIPAQVRFLSCEPLLGPLGPLDLSAIDWVIVGGESGHGARRMDPSWATAIRNQCEQAGASFFFKQAGSMLAAQWGMTGKGHDFGRIPVELRVRDFPRATCANDTDSRDGRSGVAGRSSQHLGEPQPVEAL